MVIWLSGDAYEWIFLTSSNKVSVQSLLRLKPRDQQVQLTKKVAVESIDSRTAQKGWVYGLSQKIDGRDRWEDGGLNLFFWPQKFVAMR